MAECLGQRPRFFPPLWLGRRMKCIELLEELGVKSVLDLGCGEGALLRALSVPAAYIECKTDDNLPGVPPEFRPLLENDKTLHLGRVTGVDLLGDQLEQARGGIEECMGVAIDEKRTSVYQPLRWEPVEFKLWQGSLSSDNATFEGYDAIVASEVIEHLPPSVFDSFGPRVFGKYQPRHVIISTPNHEFNSYFYFDEAELEAALKRADINEETHMHPDPTRRTQRVFRDADHAFEMTQEEFELWCEEMASMYGYSVEYTGVGSLKGYYSNSGMAASGEQIAQGGEVGIPFPPPALSYHPAMQRHPNLQARIETPASFYATQFAVFTRKEAALSEFAHPDREEHLSGGPEECFPAIFDTRSAVEAVKAEKKQVLYYEKSMSPAAVSGPEFDISLLETLWREYYEHLNQISLEHVWHSENIARACRGSLCALITCVSRSGECGFELFVKQSENSSATLLQRLWIRWKTWTVVAPEREHNIVEDGPEPVYAAQYDVEDVEFGAW